MISGIVFSRISPTSIFNGTNIPSQLFYLIGLLAFGFCFVKYYFKDEFSESSRKPGLIILAAWMFVTLISGRSALRIFFFITPFICLSIAFLIGKLASYYKESSKTKEDVLTMFLFLFTAIVIAFCFLGLVGMVKTSTYQAKIAGPSVGLQWQGAMEWVR
ncbi:unnamed protein product, partial [marine sediment metagenome]